MVRDSTVLFAASAFLLGTWGILVGLLVGAHDRYTGVLDIGWSAFWVLLIMAVLGLIWTSNRKSAEEDNE